MSSRSLRRKSCLLRYASFDASVLITTSLLHAQQLHVYAPPLLISPFRGILDDLQKLVAMNIDVSRNSLILLEVQLVTASLGVSICAAIFSLYGKNTVVGMPNEVLLWNDKTLSDFIYPDHRHEPHFWVGY